MDPALENPFKDSPHGWLQWKGTEICGDFFCECGKSCHIHGTFVYYVRCPWCKQLYELNGHIKLHKVDNAPSEYLVGTDEELEESNIVKEWIEDE